MSVQNDKLTNISAYVKTSALIGVYYRLAIALLPIHFKEQGELCTLDKFPILPMKTVCFSL